MECLPLVRAAAAALTVLLASGPVAAVTAPERSLRPVARVDVELTARWDHRPRGSAWSRAALAALRTHGQPLLRVVPRDIADWCPAYPASGTAQREAFWVGLLSTLAKHESTWRADAVGGGGQWYGLLQIYPDTARRYGCRARTGEALKHGPDNLSCALRIMAVTVPRDQVVSRGMRGVAADWGPFHSSAKRADMMAWTRQQSYCTALGRSLRPVARPASLSP